jgi:hypothetical protein
MGHNLAAEDTTRISSRGSTLKPCRTRHLKVVRGMVVVCQLGAMKGEHRILPRQYTGHDLQKYVKGTDLN